MKNILSSDLVHTYSNTKITQFIGKLGISSLNLAKTQKKPILLSIGYSSCHWCHVMAHESFEDQSTADLMNKFLLILKLIEKKGLI